MQREANVTLGIVRTPSRREHDKKKLEGSRNGTNEREVETGIRLYKSEREGYRREGKEPTAFSVLPVQ